MFLDFICPDRLTFADCQEHRNLVDRKYPVLLPEDVVQGGDPPCLGSTCLTTRKLLAI
jgi:hypothetical protein